jgi:hypothetical protein
VPQNGSSSQQTPMMTPKKTFRRVARLDDPDNDETASCASRDVQQVFEVKNSSQSHDALSSGCSGLPLNTAGATSDLSDAGTDDFLGVSNPAVTPTSAVLAVVASTPNLDAEVNTGEFSGDNSVAVVSFPVSVDEDSFIKCIEDDNAGSKAHGMSPTGNDHCKRSSKHNQHSSRGKTCSSKKANRLHHSRSGWYFSSPSCAIIFGIDTEILIV